MSALRRLLERDTPPVQVWVCEGGLLEAFAGEASLRPDLRLLTLDGSQARTSPRLFEALAQGLSFPPHFGHNWDALDECLHDLEWIPQSTLVLLVGHSEQLLVDEEEGLALLLGILASAAKELEEPVMGNVCLRRAPLALRVLLQVNPAVASLLRGRLRAAGRELPHW
ncbi:MAG: barstar family protein [Acidobacteria bacterium]|nr:barstar family protein [Acidobacteriota bacterium]